jgi:hypothetical protein
MKKQMQLMTILAAGLLATGCNASGTPANGNELATPSTAAPAPNTSSGAVATGGHADGARPADAPGSATPAAVPVWREVTIPAGTTLPVVLDTGVNSETSRVEEPVTAHLSRAITVGGMTALPEGSRVTGVVTDATRSGKVKDSAHIAMRFDSLTPRNDDQRYDIRTAAVGRARRRRRGRREDRRARRGRRDHQRHRRREERGRHRHGHRRRECGVVLATRGKEVGLAKGAGAHPEAVRAGDDPGPGLSLI